MATASDSELVDDLLRYIQGSPTPHHCVQESTQRLRQNHFVELDEGAPWELQSGRGYFVRRGGSLLAFRVGERAAAEGGFRVLGAHTDSPNLRLKPVPDVVRHGYAQLGVEVYGGVLTYTWLDRDLGLAGRVFTRGPSATSPRSHLVHLDRPLLRVPSLAIHLNRAVRTEGLVLNDQEHLAPVLTLAPDEDKPAPRLKALLGRELKLDPDQVLGWDLSLTDVVPPTRGGLEGEMLLSPRLDNQAMCHAALSALLAAAPSLSTQVVTLYDHEEVGSASEAGAAGPAAHEVLRRLAETEGPGATAGGLPRAVARSYQISADMAHAVHPNYGDRHEPNHLPALNGGPVIKINTQQRYATDGETASMFESLCLDADIPCQKFVTRTDLACGSTIGPISATRFGIRTVDVGNPMLSMHSIREQAGSADHPAMITVMQAFLET